MNAYICANKNKSDVIRFIHLCTEPGPNLSYILI